jgi:hypothetical protein
MRFIVTNPHLVATGNRLARAKADCDHQRQRAENDRYLLVHHYLPDSVWLSQNGKAMKRILGNYYKYKI